MTIYLGMDDLLAVADAALAPAQPAIRDLGLLESALARPRTSVFGDDAYPDLYTKAAALMESLARNHALVDGNKRLAWVGMRLFIALNGADIQAPTPAEADTFVRDVAQGHLDLAEMARVLQSWASPPT